MISPNTKGWISSGRGSVSAEVAKSGSEVLNQESETAVDISASTSEGGRKPVFATGSAPFHSGRGLGRGHGPETK